MRMLNSAIRRAASSVICGLLIASPMSTVPVEITRVQPAAAAVASPFDANKIDLEVWYQLRLHYVDDSYGQLGADRFREYGARLRSREPLGEQAALDEAQALVEALGDPYTYLVSADKYGQDLGRMGSPKPPPSPSPAAEPPLKTSSPMQAQQPSEGQPRPVSKPPPPSARPTVRWQTIELQGGVRRGYLRVAFLAGNTATEMRQALVELRSAGASDLVLDLRGNGGGSVAAAVEAVGLFAPEPAPRPLVVLRTTEKGGVISTRSSTSSAIWDRPVEVWVDGRTASAAEVLAGALHDSCRPSARLVGARSFGKGIIQGYYPLSNGGALVQSIARTETPSGRAISDGLSPDISRVLKSSAPKGIGRETAAETGDEILRLDVQAAQIRGSGSRLCPVPPAL